MLSSLAMDQNLAEEMMRMMTGGVVAQSISVAAELGIADQLRSGDKSSSHLAALLNADEQKLHRLLRFLASVGIFQVNTEGAWHLTRWPGSCSAMPRIPSAPAPACWVECPLPTPI